MVLATLLALSTAPVILSMQDVTVKPDTDTKCNLPIAYAKGRITSHFGVRDNPWGPGKKFHYGIDIAAKEGVEVKAVTSGRVYFARRSKSGGGLQINIRAPGNLKFKYSHMSKLLVRRGQSVRAGQVIGLVGNTGKSKGSHLHLEVYYNNGWSAQDFIDPRQFVCKYRENIWKKHSH
tara:strand:- start:18 stop:548 length:531 start_codon:yes stop_codon:yes gene_type:complete